MISSWNSKIFKWQKLRRYWINPIFISCRVILNFWVTISNPFSILLFENFLFLFTLLYPFLFFFEPFNGQTSYIFTEKPCIMIFFLANIIICLAFTLSPCLSFLYLETADILLTAACGDLLPQ